MTTPLIPQDDFNEITQLIHAARQRAVRAGLDRNYQPMEKIFAEVIERSVAES